jgi:hypothetical protein
MKTGVVFLKKSSTGHIYEYKYNNKGNTIWAKHPDGCEYKYDDAGTKLLYYKGLDGTEYELKNNKWCKIEKE